MAKIYVQLKKGAVTPGWSEGQTYRVLDVDNVQARFLLMDEESKAIQYFPITNCFLSGYSDRGEELVWVQIREGVVSGNFQKGKTYLVLSIDNVNDRFLLAEPGSKDIQYFAIGDCQHGRI